MILDEINAASANGMVVVTVKNKCWHLESFQILSLAGFRKRLEAEVRRGELIITLCSQNGSRTPSEIFASGRL
jgi:hypothetical protein